MVCLVLDMDILSFHTPHQSTCDSSTAYATKESYGVGDAEIPWILLNVDEQVECLPYPVCRVIPHTLRVTAQNLCETAQA